MLRIFLVFVLFLTVFAGVIFYLLQQPGFVNISYGSSSTEIKLVDFVAALFLAIPLLYLLIRIINYIFSTPKRIQAANVKRKQNKRLDDTKDGMTKFILGDWPGAEKLLLRAAETSVQNKNQKIEDGSTACMNYIWAARAAHESADYSRRDQYLDKAKGCGVEEQSAFNVLQAELLLDQGLAEQALATLNQESDQLRNNAKIAGLYTKAYAKLQAWDKLAEILPEIFKNKQFPAEDLEQIQQQVAYGLIKQNQNDIQAIEQIGSTFNNVITADLKLTNTYINVLREHKSYNTAEAFTAKALDTKWDSELVRLYGLLAPDEAGKILSKAEKWLTQHNDDANLYLTLGRLCKRAQLWGKAKTYLETSIKLKPQSEAYAELTFLHERLNETDAAQKCAKKCLELVVEST